MKLTKKYLVMVLSPTVAQSPVAINSDLSKWFLVASVLLLGLIVVAQIWPGKEEERKDIREEKENDDKLE